MLGGGEGSSKFCGEAIKKQRTGVMKGGRVFGVRTVWGGGVSKVLTNL